MSLRQPIPARRAGWIGLLVAAVGVGLGVAEEPPSPATTQPAPATQPAGKSAGVELYGVERSIDRLFVNCSKCRGKGEYYGGRCPDCGGTGKVFGDKYQELVDQYLAYCDLLDKHAEAIKADKALTKRTRDRRTQYLEVIRQFSSPRVQSGRVLKGPQAEYRGSDVDEGPYTRLAIDLLVAPSNWADRGIAFSGTVLRVIRKDDRALADVRLQAAGRAIRNCFVRLPSDAKWEESTKVKIVGRLVEGSEDRKLFDLESTAMIVEPYPGTE